jgi:hypothetical protein
VIKKAAIAIVVLLAAGAAVLRSMSAAAPKAIPTSHVQRGRV